MKGLFGILSAGAAVAIIGAALMVGSASYCGTPLAAAEQNFAAGGFDLRALFVGMAGGAAVANAWRVRWAELPGRVMAWIKANEHNVHRVGWVVLLLAVLFFY